MFPLPISIRGIIILLIISYGFWIVGKKEKINKKASGMSIATAFMILKLILVAIFVYIMVYHF